MNYKELYIKTKKINHNQTKLSGSPVFEYFFRRASQAAKLKFFASVESGTSTTSKIISINHNLKTPIILGPVASHKLVTIDKMFISKYLRKGFGRLA